MGCPVAGSSVGLLHLMEVPRYLRKRAHNELRAMEELMQQHVQVAEYMAKSMVGPTCMPSPRNQSYVHIVQCSHCAITSMRHFADSITSL